MVNCIKQVPQILRQIVCDTIFLSFCEILEMVGKTAAEKWWQIQMDEIIMIQRSQSSSCYSCDLYTTLPQ